ncbi:uncharacterized protein [Amphiura filiformis]|uniref:uncharacterized protein n=1 Tax=Amphiura filiformis TaxID=82378 RepID=UPI003B21E1E0
MAYIHKLKLSHPQRVQVTKFIQAIQRHQERLKSQYRKEEYAEKTTDERLLIAETLLRTNVPASALLLKDLLEEQMSIKQKLQCLHNLYVAYMALGPLSEGLKYAEEQYHLSKMTPAPESLTESENQQLQFQAACDVGNAHCFLGNLDKAKIFLDEAKEIASKMADPDKIALATIHHGNWLLASGQLKIAMGEVFRPLMGVSLCEYNQGLMLQGYGNACRSAADWGPAKDHLRESIAIAEALNDTVSVAARQGDLGTTYRSEGRTADALMYQQKHYQFAKERGDRAGLCVACFNLGFTYYTSKPTDVNSTAPIYHTVQLELAHSIGLPGMKSRALNCLGKVFTSLNNFDGAIQLFNECVELHSQTGNVAGLGMAYGNLGTAYRALAQYDDAVMYHEKYKDNAKERDDIGGVAIMQKEIALDYMFQEKYEMAEKSIKDTLITLEEIRSKLGAEDTSRIANYEKNQAEAFNLLQTILVQRGKTIEALVLSERGRARALADIIHSKLTEFEQHDKGMTKHLVGMSEMDEVHAGSENAENIIKLTKKLNVTLLVYSIVTEFSEQSSSSKWVYIWVVTMATDDTDEGPHVHFAKRQLTRIERDHSKSTIDDQYVNSLCRSLGNLNMDDDTQEQPEDASTCEDDDETDCQDDWRRDAGHSYRRHQDPHLDIPDSLLPQTIQTPNIGGINSDAIPVTSESQDKGQSKEKKLPHQEEILKTRPLSPAQQKELDKLRADYELFIAPIEKYLPASREDEEGDNVPRIAIIPQGFLFNLPFCALLDHNNKHLMQKYIISFAPSIQVLQLTHHRLDMLRQQTTKTPLSVLAVGNPKMPHPKVVPLPAANREVQMVKNHFDQRLEEMSDGGVESVVVTGSNATVGFVRYHMANHDVLHIATHAEQDEGIADVKVKVSQNCSQKPEPSPAGDFSMRGFLVLARTNDSCSGLLTAEEIKDQQLKAEVAVLSCCQTGIGQVTGDGVLGLYRSFLAAGAASVVVTHWKIFDKATAKFMRHFYQDYKVHRDPAQALRTAMLRMLGDRLHHGPQYWAAFALIGASTNMKAIV